MYAILGAYLNTIGLSESAIAYITMAASNSMTWLTLQVTEKYGIEVHPLSNATASPSLSPPAPSRGDVAAAASDRERQTWYFIVATNAAWSAPMLDDVAAAFGQVYADQVVYYGRALSRGDVFADKQRFIRRWPRRQYTPRAADAAVQCNGDTCSVAGLVDWETWNTSTAAHARGSARYEYAVAWGANGPRITLETSVAVAREKTGAPGKKSGPELGVPQR